MREKAELEALTCPCPFGNCSLLEVFILSWSIISVLEGLELLAKPLWHRLRSYQDTYGIPDVSCRVSDLTAMEKCKRLEGRCMRG